MTLCIFKKKIKLGGWRPDPTNKIYLSFDSSKLSLTKNTIEYVGDQDIDLRPYSSPIQNQGATGSCVANSLVKALEIKRIIKKGHVAHVDLSRLSLYYNARERMNPSEVNKDGGAYISIACDCLRQFGVCRESLHPFSTTNLYKRPSDMAMREGRLNRIKSHFKIKTQGNKLLDDIIFNLHAGNPVVFGTKVGDDWMSYKGGKEPLRVETRPKGGHCMCCLGFVDGLFVIENSWSKNWGDSGFGYVAPEVFKHASTRDFWVIVDGSESWTEKK